MLPSFFLLINPANFVIVNYTTKPEVFASWANNIMLGRLGHPEDVAGVVAFLASKDAAFLTAETIQVGGGQALGI